MEWNPFPEKGLSEKAIEEALKIRERIESIYLCGVDSVHTKIGYICNPDYPDRRVIDSE